MPCHQLTSDHVHIVARLRAVHRLADVIRDLKANSSKWAHEVVGARFFGWQDGYGAFSVSNSDLEAWKQYIRDQRKHHRNKAFKEEYLDLLRGNGADFDEKFLWE